MMTKENLELEIHKSTVDQKPIFRNLMQYYKYDSSDYTLEDPNSFGQFDYNYLDHYWTEHGIKMEGREAYLVTVNQQLAGFVLVNNFNLRSASKNDTRNIAEFFIMRKWRRLGVGKYAAHEIFNTFKEAGKLNRSGKTSPPIVFGKPSSRSIRKENTQGWNPIYLSGRGR